MVPISPLSPQKLAVSETGDFLFFMHKLTRIFFLPLIIAEENHGQDNKEEEEEKGQDEQLVGFLNQKTREPNTNFHTTGAVRVPVLLVVFLRDLNHT